MSNSAVTPIGETKTNLEKTGRADDLIRLYESRSREVSQPEEAAALLCQAADLALSRMRDPARSEELYRRALVYSPHARQALEGLKGLAQSSNDHATLVEVLERLAVMARGAGSAALYLEAGLIAEKKLLRRDRAVLNYQLASRAEPRNREAYRRARGILLDEEHWAAALGLLDRERAALGDRDLGEEYLALAEALVDSPHLQALAATALDCAQALEPRLGRIWSTRRAIAELKDTWRDRAKQLRVHSLDARDRKIAARLSLKVARLQAFYEPGAEEKRQEALDRCLALWPAMPQALDLVEEAAERAGEIRAALAMFSKLAEESRDRQPRCDLFLRMGQLLLRLNERSEAAQAFEKAAAADPTRADAAELASELLIDLGKKAEGLGLLERHLETVREKKAQLALRLHLSQLCLGLMGDETGARRHLSLALGLEPRNAVVAWRLAALAQHDATADALSPVLELAVCAPQPIAERVALCRRAAHLCETSEKPSGAYDALALAVGLAPGDASLLAEIATAARSAAQEAPLAALLRRIAQVSEKDAQLEVWRALARLLGRLGRTAEARQAWSEVHRRDETDAEATAALAVAREAAPAGGAIGSPHDAATPDPQSALKASGTVLETEQDDVVALTALAAGAERMGQWNEFAQAAERLLALADSPEDRREWKTRLAHVYAERLERREEAVRILLSLLAEGDESAAVVGGLERLAALGVRQGDIAQVLAPVYARAKDFLRQVASLLVQLARVEATSEKKGLLTLLAETTEVHLLDARSALDFRLRGLKLDPADGSFRTEVVRLVQLVGAQQEYCRFVTELAPTMSDRSLAASLILEAAELAQAVSAVDAAAKTLRVGLERSPEEVLISERLIALYRRGGQWAECELLLRQRMASADSSDKAAVGLQWAQANIELGRPKEAANALSQALAAGAPALEHLPRLASLLEQAGQLAELTQVQASLIDLYQKNGQPERAAAIGIHRARVLETQLGDKAEAIRRYAEVLTARPTDPDAVAALENLLTDSQHRPAAAWALLPAYEAQLDHRNQARVLSVIAESSQDSLEKVTALRRAAQIHARHLRQPIQAFSAYSAAFRLAPDDGALRDAARAAAEEADSLDAFGALLEEVLKSRQGATALILHRELAGLFERRLGNHQAAALHCYAVLEVEPKDADALRALQRLHRGREQWHELVPVVERLSVQETDPAAKRALLWEAAVLCETKLHDLERAAANVKQLAAGDVLDREAAVSLERLSIELDRPNELAFALQLRRNQEGDSASGREVAFRLAALRRERLHDARAALEGYRHILAEDPQHAGTLAVLEAWAASDGPEAAEALKILDPVLAQKDSHTVRLALRESRLASESNAEERTRIASEIRDIFERDLKQPQGAFLNALRMFASGDGRRAVRADLERLADDLGAFDELAELYETVAAESTGGAEERVGLYRKAAELREKLSQSEAATQNYKRVLEQAPDDARSLHRLSVLYEEAKNAKSLAVVFAQRANLATSPDERRELLLKTADALEKAGDDAQAIECLKSALALRRDHPVLESLDRLYARLHLFAEEIEVLRQLEEVAGSDALRVSHAKKRAGLLEKTGQLGQAAQVWGSVLEASNLDADARAALEGLLRSDACRLDAARFLEPMYRAQSELAKLADVLDLKLEAAEPSRRLPLLLEIATLREALGDRHKALGARVAAFTIAPHDPEVGEELERLVGSLGNFEVLVQAYEEVLGAGAKGELAAELWRKMAIVSSERLSRLDLAARAWNEALALRPKDASVLHALGRLYRQTGQFKELSIVMRRQLALEPDPAIRSALLFELAQLCEAQLSDKAMAAQCYQAILEFDPAEERAIEPLTRILAETERWPELAATLARQLQLAQDGGREEQALELMVRLGRLRLTRLEDSQGALHVFQEVLRRRPAHAGAVGALEEMARSDNPHKSEAASTLEPVFAQEGDHLKLVQMLEAQVGSEQSPNERATLLRRMAQVYSQHLDNPALAFVASARALREFPDDPKNLDLVLLFFKSAEATDELSALLSEVAPAATDEGARVGLYRALARLQAQEGQGAAAVEAWKRVVELVPTDHEAMEQLSTLLGRLSRLPELLDVIKRQLNIEEDTDRRVALLLQMATVQEEQLNDLNGAAATLRRLLELKPDDMSVLERLEKLAEGHGRWPELADLLSRRLKLVQPNDRAEVAVKLGIVRETRLLDRPGAVELYAEVLSADPTHQGALARLEAMVQREQNQSATHALLTAYRQHGDPSKLAQLIDVRVGASPDAVERKGLLSELAKLRGDQGEPELAYLAWYRAYKEDPNDSAIRAQLVAAAAAANSWDELAHALEGELGRLVNPEEAAKVCVTLGQVFEQRLGEKEKALAFYDKARKLHPQVGSAALPALDRLYGEFGRLAEQAEVLEMLAGIASEPSDKVTFSYRLGQLSQESLDAPDRAAAAFERVLEHDAKHLPSLRSLEALYEKAKSSEKLYRVLETQRDLVSGAERERVLAKMAFVSGEDPARADASIALYRELLEKNPRNENAFEALTSLLDRSQRHEDLKALLQWKLQFTVDPRELVRLNERAGRVLFERLKRPEEAIAFFKAALDRDARHRGAMEALKDLYEQTGKQEDLVVILRRLVPLQEDATGLKGIRIRLAETLARMGRREEALDAARRALEVESQTEPDLDRIGAVFSGLKAWPDVVRALEEKCRLQLGLEEREAAAATMFQVADLWRTTANKPELAGGALERVLEIEPSSRKAYDQVLKLYAELNDWRSYAQVVERYLPQLVTDDEKVQSLRELGRIQETRLGAKHVAFLQYCRALQLAPSDDQTREQVERLAEETGSHEELAAVYEELADALPKGPLAERVYLTLALVHDSKLDDAEAAEASLRKILEFDPTNEAALDRLASMFARRGHTKEYIVALEQKLEAVGSLEKRKEILREIARVYDEQLAQLDEAENALVRALELEPDLETLGILAAMQRRRQDHAAVASTLLRMRDLASTPEERSGFQVEVAQVYERDLADEEAAVEGYRQALEFDPGNAQALEALENLYTKLQRPGELLTVYERQLELTHDYRERVKVLFSSAAIWEEHFQNLANADACIYAALEVDPQNLQAVKVLERLRRAQGRWDELIGVLERHLHLAQIPQERGELCVEMGDVFHQQLKAVDRAVTAYHQALDLDPQCRSAMHALGTLYERSGNWPFALEMLQREAQELGASSDAVELWYRMGKINEDMLSDSGTAKQCFLQALDLEPTHLPAIRSLKAIADAQNDLENYEKFLVEEARQTQDPEAKAKALVQVGRHFEGREERSVAAQSYEEALGLVPDLLEAALPLADLALAAENWERCEQMLDIVAQKLSEQYAAAPDDAELSRELCRRCYRLGYVCEKNGRREKALSAYEKAYQLDSTYLPVLEGYGNLLVQAKRYEEAAKVYQSILVHHRGELTDLEVAEIYWTLGDIHLQGRQLDRAENHFEKALAIDGGHEPSLRSMAVIAEARNQWEKSAEFRQKLLQVLEGEPRFEEGVALGALARERLKDAYIAIDAYLAAYRVHPDALEVMDALYVLYRETQQGARAAEILEKMLEVPALQKDPQRAKRVWFGLGEIARDELQDFDRAARCFNAALDLDWRFIDAFSALEQLLGRNKQWQLLDENYKRMLARFPKSDETHVARMTLWKALGDLYLNVLKAPEAATEVYRVVAAGLPDNPEVQEQYAGLLQQQPGKEQEAVDAWRRALPSTSTPGRAAAALAELAARRKDYDSAWLAAQVVNGLIGDPGAGEREILSKLTPYAKKRETAQRQLTDRLWTEHLFHPKVRGPLGELLGIVFEQAGSLYKEELARYGINPRKHLVDVASAPEYQLSHYRYVARLFGMEQVALYSPFLIATRERLAKRSVEPAPDPMVSVELCHTEPVCLKVGGKFFSEAGQKEVYYLLGRTMALLRPELALTQRISAERLEAVLQAAISLSVDRFRFTADLRAIDTERKALERQLTQQARDALSRVTRQYVAVAASSDLRNFLEGAELTATRAGAFAAAEIEPVKKMVLSESGGQFRVQPRSKIRELMVFALGEDLHALRVAVGTSVEVQLRK